MSDVEVTVDVDAQPEAVWAVLSDVGRVDEWLTVHDEFTEDPPQVREGAEISQRVSSGDISAEVEWFIEEVDEPAFMAWRGRATGGATLLTTYRLVPTATGTRVECATDFEIPGGPLGAVAAKIAAPRGREEASASLDRLRALVEGSS